jgi:hypothetical protein
VQRQVDEQQIVRAEDEHPDRRCGQQAIEPRRRRADQRRQQEHEREQHRHHHLLDAEQAKIALPVPDAGPDPLQIRDVDVRERRLEPARHRHRVPECDPIVHCVRGHRRGEQGCRQPPRAPRALTHLAFARLATIEP